MVGEFTLILTLFYVLKYRYSHINYGYVCEAVNVNKCEILIFAKIEIEWLKFPLIMIKVMGPCEDESTNTQIMENLFPSICSKRTV